MWTAAEQADFLTHTFASLLRAKESHAEHTCGPDRRHRPVEPALLTAWTAHYRTLGVGTSASPSTFPTTSPTPGSSSSWPGLRPRYRPTNISTGPWHEHITPQLRDACEQAGPGWHLLADADEFHSYPAPLR
ncbi:hypothetical protein O1L55_03650 [Streptomyces albulus]|nr:hypothetical protein [Streptomyces noursei]